MGNLLQQISAMPQQQQLQINPIYLQQLLQTAQQPPIRMVNINQMQQLQQLQHAQTTQPQIPIPIPLPTQNGQVHTKQNNRMQQQTHYQTPPRQQRQQHIQQRQQNQQFHQQPSDTNNNNNNKMRQQKQQQPLPQSAKQSKTNTQQKSTSLLDKLCKYCLLSDHAPSKCVWFNPNIKRNKH